MTLKFVMNTAGEIGHSDGSVITGGIFTPTSTPSSTCFAGGLPIYRGPLAFVFVGGSSPGFVDGTVMSVVGQVIQPTSQEVPMDGLMPIRVCDGIVLCDFLGTLPSGGIATAIGPIEIVDAGQSKVSAQ